MTLQWLLGWWNLVFLVPLMLALMYLAIYLASGVTFGDADADAHADVDADAGVDADGHVDADVDAHAEIGGEADLDATAAEAGADADAAADAHAGHHHPEHAHAGRGGLAGAMAWVGVGRMPLSLVLMVLLLTWGFIGFVANQFLRGAVPREWMIPLVSLPAAAFGCVLATRVFTRTVARFMPIEETYARRRNELLGEVGEAIYAIDERFGMAAVRDDRGNLYQVACRAEPGHAPIAKGTKVLLVAHDAKHNIFHVTPDEAGVLARDRSAAAAASPAAVTKRGLP